FHFHLVVLDGVFSEQPDGGVRFHEATHLSPDDAACLAHTVQRRVLRLFRRRGLLDSATVADMLSWQGSGGFSVDASVRIAGTDRTGRERLLRYCARPPFALERLHVERAPPRGPMEEGRSLSSNRSHEGDQEPRVRRVLYHPARPTPDGRTVLALAPLEFLAALSRLIPPPRVHRHRYHGVLAPNARLRAHVVAMGREPDVLAGRDTRANQPAGASGPQPIVAASSHARHAQACAGESGLAARSRWARLLARIYEVFPMRCPGCGADMRILAFLTRPEHVVPILRHLNLPASPPRLTPARAPPQPTLDFDVAPDVAFDQTPAFDPTEPEPAPALQLDQTTGV
ncbi:MAG TPA: transposase, partial [Vicinamibacteria bacterium]|nr:transposase [Vicinamibacteria bacterium]